MAAAPTKSISLALQGGGAHGAYTWGVLDRLLEDERIVIDGISGTSAGAMNAAVLVSGFAHGSYEGARRSLEEFWRRISELAVFSPFQQTMIQRWLTGWNLDTSPAYMAYDIASHIVSPYELNPMNINPVRVVLEQLVDIDALNKSDGIKLFITATSVRTGRPHIFDSGAITFDVLMASACLPLMFQAVEIDGEAFWDGGYTGNPAIWPLIYHAHTHDIIMVQINPFVREGVPKRAYEIVDRMNEIGFNTALVGELRAIRFVSKLIHKNKLNEKEYKDLHMHMIFSPKELHDLNASSKMNPSWDFFVYLRDIGREAADAWLKKNFEYIGKKATFNFEEIFELKKKPAVHNG